MRAELAPIADELSMLADEVLTLLETHIKSENLSGNESQTERHIQNSNPDSLIDLEPGFPKRQGARVEANPEPRKMPEGSYPLGMILDACPDIVDYAKGGISNWRDFMATAAVVRPMLGVSPSAWEQAQAAMGEVQAAIAVAAILQKGAAINSAGGYLRELTRKSAESGAAMTVQSLRKWINEPRCMGLPQECENLIILVFAAQTNRSFFQHAVPMDANLNKLPDDYELREQQLPPETSWLIET